MNQFRMEEWVCSDKCVNYFVLALPLLVSIWMQGTMLIVEVTCRSLETILVKCWFNFMVQKVLNFTDDDLVDVGYKPVKPPLPQQNIYL